MSLFTFGASGTSDSHRMQAGLVNEAALMITTQAGGIVNQRAHELWGAVDRLCIGSLYQNGIIVTPFRGEIEHAALFAPTLTAPEESLELLSTRPDASALPAIAYWPFTADLNDAIGQNHLTGVGSPLVTADDPFPAGETSQIAVLASYYEMLRRVRS